MRKIFISVHKLAVMYTLSKLQWGRYIRSTSKQFSYFEHVHLLTFFVTSGV